MYSTIVLFLLLGVATWTDVSRHRIYNWNTYTGALVALGARGLDEGWPGVEDGVIGFLICGFIMVVCFVFFPDMGGGDVKLIAMMGVALGAHDGILAMLWTFVIGFVAGLSFLVWRDGAKNIILRLLIVVREAAVARGRSRAGSDDSPLKRWLYLAPAALVAAVIVRWEQIAEQF
jgi:prepilin peptidase CpaA